MANAAKIPTTVRTVLRICFSSSTQFRDDNTPAATQRQRCRADFAKRLCADSIVGETAVLNLISLL
jgi:hypothetical protein